MNRTGTTIYPTERWNRYAGSWALTLLIHWRYLFLPGEIDPSIIQTMATSRPMETVWWPTLCFILWLRAFYMEQRAHSSEPVAGHSLFFANGFDGLLGKAIKIYQAEIDPGEIDVLLVSILKAGDTHTITDLEDEVRSLRGIGKVYVLRQKALIKSLFSLREVFAHRIHYDQIVFSSHGDKQWIVWPLVAWFFKPRSGYFLFDLHSKEIYPISSIALWKRNCQYWFNRKTVNLALTKISRFMRLTRVFGYPQTMTVEPINICNLKCLICPTGLGTLKRKAGRMDIENFKRLLDECGTYLRHLNLYFCGEPFIYSNTLEMVNYAKQTGVSQVTISTNGNLDYGDSFFEALVGSGLDELVVSIDGATQKEYDRYRRSGSLEMAKNFIRKTNLYREQKKTLLPRIVIQFILMRHNLHQVASMEELVNEIGADSLRIKHLNPLMASISPEKASEFLPEDATCSSFIFQDGTIKLRREKPPSICSALWDSVLITWDGKILPCCADKEASVVFGNVFNESRFKKIWNNQKYRTFRRQIMKDRRVIDLCRTCTAD